QCRGPAKLPRPAVRSTEPPLEAEGADGVDDLAAGEHPYDRGSVERRAVCIDGADREAPFRPRHGRVALAGESRLERRIAGRARPVRDDANRIACKAGPARPDYLRLQKGALPLELRRPAVGPAQRSLEAEPAD